MPYNSQAGGLWKHFDALSATFCVIRKPLLNPTSFDADNDLQLRTLLAEAEEVSVRFVEPLIEYEFVEIDVQGLSATQFLLLVSTVSNSEQAALGTRTRASFRVSGNRVRTYRIPYIGEIEALFFSGFVAATPVAVKAIRVFRRPQNLELEIAPDLDGIVVNRAGVTGGDFVRDANGVWSADVPAVDSVGGTFKFTMDGIERSFGLIRIRPAQQSNAAEITIETEDEEVLESARLSAGKVIDIWVQNLWQEFAFTIANPTASLAPVQIELYLFKAVAEGNAFGVAGGRVVSPLVGIESLIPGAPGTPGDPGPGGTEILYWQEHRTTIVPNSPIPAHDWSVIGAEADIDAVIRSKGLGAFVLAVPDNTSAGGNKRGKNAVDLQMVRTNANMVAAGDNSVIVGGGRNKINAVNTSVAFGAIVGGESNSIRSAFSFVGGGSGNVAGFDSAGVPAPYSAVVGGKDNSANDQYTFVGGGHDNEASTAASAICGGHHNEASSEDCFIGAGNTNQASGDWSAIVGGKNNQANADQTFVGGGKNNVASGDSSTVAGGFGNTASGVEGTIAGGRGNTNAGAQGVIGGGSGNTNSGEFQTIGGGVGNTNEADSDYATTGGGTGNDAAGLAATIAGGDSNVINGNYGTVGGGTANAVDADYGTVGGGRQNGAMEQYSTVAGGRSVRALGDYSTAVGGLSNQAGGNYAFVGGGQSNDAGGLQSVVVGGNNNQSPGANSGILAGSYGSTHLIQGAQAHGAGITGFIGQGAAQRGNYVIGAQTTNNTATKLTTNGNAVAAHNQLELQRGMAVTFEGNLVAMQPTTLDTSGWKFEGVIKKGANNAATALVAAATITNLAADAGAATWALAITADTVNGALAFTVTGQNTKTIQWVACVRTVETIDPNA